MRLVPNSFRARILVAVLGKIFLEPATAIAAGFDFEIAKHLIIGARLEVMDLVFALGQDRESRSLHSAHRRQLKTSGAIVERGHRPGAVDPDQPVALRSTNGRLRKRHHLFLGAQMIEGVPNRILRHRLQPEAANWFLHVGELHQIAENQFAFAPGVTGVDQKVDIVAFHQLFQHAEARSRLLDRLEMKFFRNNWQVGEAPFPTLHIELAG